MAGTNKPSSSLRVRVMIALVVVTLIDQRVQFLVIIAPFFVFYSKLQRTSLLLVSSGNLDKMAIDAVHTHNSSWSTSARSCMTPHLPARQWTLPRCSSSRTRASSRTPPFPCCWRPRNDRTSSGHPVSGTVTTVSEGASRWGWVATFTHTHVCSGSVPTARSSSFNWLEVPR